MTPESVGPVSRPVPVHTIPPEGLPVRVEATPEECAALARDFDLPAVHALTGDFTLTGSDRRVEVRGRVRARVTRICVVTLDPFESDIEEEVEVDFAAADSIRADAEEVALDEDSPDPIVNGAVDLGAITAEFLAMGLDPYPRKPGAAFEYTSEETASDTPFSALGKLKGKS